jgi:hypothetical protein
MPGGGVKGFALRGCCMIDRRKIVQLQVKKMTAGNGWEFF